MSWTRPIWSDLRIRTCATDGGSFCEIPAGSPSRACDRLDDRGQVKRDLAALHLHRPGAPVDHGLERLGCVAIGPCPQGLHAGVGERQVGGMHGAGMQRAGRRAGQRPQSLGERRPDQLRDVDVGVQLVDGVVRGDLADLGVLQQPGARRRPVAGIEQLAVGPDRERRDDRQQRGEHDQRIDPAPAPGRRRGTDALTALVGAAGTVVVRDRRSLSPR